MSEAIKIGTKTLDKPEDFIQHYETAAWSRTIHCEPQTVDVTATIKNGEVKDLGIGWTFKGVVTDANFPSLFGGVTTFGGKRPQEIGEEASYTVTPYAHALARSLLDGKESGLELDVVPLYTPFTDYQGEGRYSTGLFVEPTEEQRERSRGVQLALGGEPIPNKSPEAAFGWATANQSLARDMEEKAHQLRGIAEYALHNYSPQHVPKPTLSEVQQVREQYFGDLSLTNEEYGRMIEEADKRDRAAEARSEVDESSHEL